MENNIKEIKFGTLIDWLNGNKVGINPFHIIPDCPGIYKVFIKEDDFNKVKFGKPYTVNGTPFCPDRKKPDGKVKSTVPETPEVLATIFERINNGVIYIGQAGFYENDKPNNSTLRKRLRDYANMARGKDKHRGGIDIWTVQNYEDILYVTWYPGTGGYMSTTKWESAEIEKFRQQYGERPLANRLK